MKTDIVQKITSRKFWGMIIAIIIAMIILFFPDALTPRQTDILSNAFTVICVYIFGESGVDITRILKSSCVNQNPEQEKKK